jgi:D-amino peptidase
MKVFMSVDIEGITGIVDAGLQTSDAGKDYERARRLMTGDANAAIAGAFEAGATEVLVSDGHGASKMRNMLIEELDPRAVYVAGTPKPLTQMEGIDETFSVAMLIGYHARMGSPGILSHTIQGSNVQNIWINDTPVGETGLNAAIAGAFGVPVGLVTGDQYVTEEAVALMPWVDTVVVKKAVTRTAAHLYSPLRTQPMIKAAAAAAVKNAMANKYQPLVFPRPMTYKIQFLNAGMADGAARFQAATRVNGTTLAVSAADSIVGFKDIRAMVGLGAP